MNIEQYKARAYDLITYMGQIQEELKLINNEIAKLSTKKEEVKLEEAPSE